MIVMAISDDDADGVGLRVDANFNRVMVCVNFTGDGVVVDDPILARDLAGANLELHPLQGSISSDAAYLSVASWRAGAVTVPPHSAVVFVEKRR